MPSGATPDLAGEELGGAFELLRRAGDRAPGRRSASSPIPASRSASAIRAGRGKPRAAAAASRRLTMPGARTTVAVAAPGLDQRHAELAPQPRQQRLDGVGLAIGAAS